MSLPEQLPSVFGNYLLLKRLAVGGMAELYVAKNLQTQGLCVIKRILPHLSVEAEFVQMFLDEARIASQLHHENIVEVYELGTQDGTFFIAMEYLDGTDLRNALRIEAKHNRAIPPHIVAYIGTRICAGLYAAHHERGLDGRPMELIHRDVNPQNVMALYDGRVKLVDFGIAKAGAFMAQSKPGVLKGKFLYLAPEQIGDELVDRRADIFAVGSLLYECVTGVSPFTRQNSEAVLLAIRTEAPLPPHEVRAGCPKKLSEIILKCLEKNPAERFQEANEVQAELQAFLDTQRPTSRRDLQDYLATIASQDTSRLRIEKLLELASPPEGVIAVTDSSLIPVSEGRRPTRHEAPISLPPPPVDEDTLNADVRELKRKFRQDDMPGVLPKERPTVPERGRRRSSSEALDSISPSRESSFKASEARLNPIDGPGPRQISISPGPSAPLGTGSVESRRRSSRSARRVRAPVIDRRWMVVAGGGLALLGALAFFMMREDPAATVAASEPRADAGALIAIVPQTPPPPPEPVEEEAPPEETEEPEPVAPKRKKKAAQSSVVFKAPPGTVIQALGKRYRPETTYHFKTGTLKLKYTCPKTSRAETLTRRIPSSRKVVYVALRCR